MLYYFEKSYIYICAQINNQNTVKLTLPDDTKPSEINHYVYSRTSNKIGNAYEAGNRGGAAWNRDNTYITITGEITFPERRINAFDDLRVFPRKFSPRFLDSIRFRWYVNIDSLRPLKEVCSSLRLRFHGVGTHRTLLK